MDTLEIAGARARCEHKGDPGACRVCARESDLGTRRSRRGGYWNTGQLAVALTRDGRFLTLSTTAKLVALVLVARWADAEGKAWPRVKEIASLVGKHRSTVQTAIRELETVGIIEVVTWMHDGTGAQTTNTYYFDKALGAQDDH